MNGWTVDLNLEGTFEELTGDTSQVQPATQYTRFSIRHNDQPVVEFESVKPYTLHMPGVRQFQDTLDFGEQALKIMQDLLDPDECSDIDHHGYCQTHGWFETDPPCPHKRARALLAEMESRWGTGSSQASPERPSPAT